MGVVCLKRGSILKDCDTDVQMNGNIYIYIKIEIAVSYPTTNGYQPRNFNFPNILYRCWSPRWGNNIDLVREHLNL